MHNISLHKPSNPSSHGVNVIDLICEHTEVQKLLSLTYWSPPKAQLSETFFSIADKILPCLFIVCRHYTG